MQDKEILDTLKDIRQSKDIDAIADLFTSIVDMYGLTVDEVCALCYYIVERSLKSDNNKRFLRERLQLDVDTLAPDGILQVQRAMVAVYVDKVRDNAKTN